MRSRLEARFAAWLDRHAFEWVYEPCCFANESGQYLPDFLVTSDPLGRLPVRVPAYVEVKARVLSHTVLQKQLAIIRASQPTAELILAVSPGWETDFTLSPVINSRLIIQLTAEHFTADHVCSIRDALKANPGNLPVHLHLLCGDRTIAFELGAHHVSGSEHCIKRLRAVAHTAARVPA